MKSSEDSSFSQRSSSPLPKESEKEKIKSVPMKKTKSKALKVSIQPLYL